jgi:hypothetical protein
VLQVSSSLRTNSSSLPSRAPYHACMGTTPPASQWGASDWEGLAILLCYLTFWERPSAGRDCATKPSMLSCSASSAPHSLIMYLQYALQHCPQDQAPLCLLLADLPGGNRLGAQKWRFARFPVDVRFCCARTARTLTGYLRVLQFKVPLQGSHNL